MRSCVPKPHEVLQALHIPVAQEQPERSTQSCHVFGPGPQFAPHSLQEASRCCLPKPQVELHFDQEPTSQLQPLTSLHVWLVFGSIPLQSSSTMPGHHTFRVWVPSPQYSEQADHSDVNHEQACLAMHERTSEGLVLRSQFLFENPLHTTLRVCKPEPHVALHNDQVEADQPHDVESRQR